MNRIAFIILLSILTACQTTKQAISYEKVTNGKDLEKIYSISVDSFLNQWVHNRKIQKVDLNVKELNKDNQYTYFGKPKLGLTKTKRTFFKVQTDTLTEHFPDYKNFYGEELIQFLWKKVIPKEDVDLWNSSRTIQQNEIKSKCPYRKNKPINHYSLIDKKVIYTMSWDIECEELEKLKNKLYKASYNLLTKEYQ